METNRGDNWRGRCGVCGEETERMYQLTCGEPVVGVAPRCGWSVVRCENHGGDQEVLRLMGEHMTAQHTRRPLAPVGRTTGYARPAFCGVPVTEFCDIDRPAVERVIASPVLIGLAGLCGACTAKIDAAAQPAPDRKSKPEVDHPSPWRWEDDERLVDANGETFLLLECTVGLPPRVRALIAAVPEMLALLRESAALGASRCTKRLGGDPLDARTCVSLGWPEAERCIGCRLAALLDRLPNEGA